MQVAMGFVGNYAPRGLSPQMFDMPVILKKPVRNEQAETGIYVFTDAKSCYAIKIEFKLSTE